MKNYIHIYLFTLSRRVSRNLGDFRVSKFSENRETRLGDSVIHIYICTYKDKNDKNCTKYLHAMETRSTPRWRNYLQRKCTTLGHEPRNKNFIKITRDYASLEKVRHNNTVKNSSLKNSRRRLDKIEHKHDYVQKKNTSP